MNAFVTSIGEKTTELCVWALERNGFKVVLFEGKNRLSDKLVDIYNYAKDDFIRVDADIIVNKNCTPHKLEWIMDGDDTENAWWVQFQTYDWYKQDVGYGGVQYIRKEAIELLRQNARRFLDNERPETALSRLAGLYEPRKFESVDIIMGLNNYRNNLDRVMKVKEKRGQMDNYDFELAKRLEEL